MTNMREILTNWSTATGGAGTTVMYFAESAASAAAQRAALGTFWGVVDNYLDSNTAWNVQSFGNVIESETGTLTGEWTESTPQGAAGGVVGNALPNASQILVRWGTGVIYQGKRIRGRTFVPGVASTALVEGEVGSAAVAAINTAALALASAGVGFGVWSRPRVGVPGLHAAATTGTVWGEFAVQRRRRS